MVGGICRGKAKGNAPAFVDLESTSAVSSHSHKGQVFVHMDDTSPPYSIVQPILSLLPTALHHASSLFSPIKNSRISVWENGAWALKGHYAMALTSREVLPWTQNDKGEWSVKLRAEQTAPGPSQLLPSPFPSDGSTVPGASSSIPNPSISNSTQLSSLQE